MQTEAITSETQENNDVKINEQVNFEDFEKDQIKEIKQNKIIWFGERNLPFKKRLYQFIATLIVVMANNFMTKLKWQVALVLYLLITVPMGSYQLVKLIINIFN